MQGKVLIIGGSDSGGGAGIQGDLKTVSAFNAYASTAITALTAQNTTEIKATTPLATDFIALQIEAVLSDIGADVIKIGMLYNTDIIQAVADSITQHAPNTPLIIDPVMVSKGGATLLSVNAINTLIERLINTCTLVTPNIPEAEKLADIRIHSHEDMLTAAKEVKNRTKANAVLLKGGHLNGDDLIDILVTNDDYITLQSSRIASSHTHGTGCAYASAIAALLSQGTPLAGAVKIAHDYIEDAILAAPEIGSGYGPLNHFPDA